VDSMQDPRQMAVASVWGLHHREMAHDGALSRLGAPEVQDLHNIVYVPRYGKLMELILKLGSKPGDRQKNVLPKNVPP
jgi:hypothetical protein